MVVGTPEVRTGASTEVGFVTFGFMDPFPVQVTPEVNVERAQAAALVRATATKYTHRNTSTPILLFKIWGRDRSWEKDNKSPLKTNHREVITMQGC